MDAKKKSLNENPQMRGFGLQFTDAMTVDYQEFMRMQGLHTPPDHSGVSQIA